MSSIFETKAVLYDMDGILIDSEKLWEQAEREVINSYGVDYDEMRHSNNIVTTGMRIDQAIDLYCRLEPNKCNNAAQIIQRVLDVTIEKMLKQDIAMPGIHHSLELCRELGLKVGLASSSPMRVIDVATDYLGITELFDVRVSAEVLPYGKPHPGVYLLAAEKIGINPLNCLTIEDSIAGMIATKAAQMKSIVIPAAEARMDPRWCMANHKLNSLLALTAQHLA